MRALVLCTFLLACGGTKATSAEVTVAPQAATSAQPAASGSLLPQAPACSKRLPDSSICFSGGDGGSIEHAVVILGAKGEQDGVAAEYKYLEMLYGPRGAGYTVSSQSLLEQNGKSYDRLDIEVKGKPLGVFFDISDYFGKF